MANFAVTQDVRIEAWFEGNSNIYDSQIELAQDQAHGFMITILASKYDTTYLDTSNDNFDDSTAHHTLAGIEQLRAAGLLLIAEYWPDGTEQKENGEQKIKEAKDTLMALLFGTPDSPAGRLIGDNGVEFTTVAVSPAGAIQSTGMENIDTWIDHCTQF